ncbi:hypothetical protein R6Q59_017570 [Mikania micrantha]
MKKIDTQNYVICRTGKSGILEKEEIINTSKFGENVLFVTVSETPNFMAIMNDLLNPNPFNQPIQFQGNEDAKNKLGNFLNEKVSRPMLIVLDDV